MAKEEEFKPKVWQASDVEYVGEAVGTVYANNGQISFSNWDMSMMFGEIVGEKDSKLRIAPRVRVTMSLQHAKAFLEAYQKAIANFEARFGQISLFDTIEPERKKAK